MLNSRIEVDSRRIDYIREVFAQTDEALASVGCNLPDNEKRMQIGADEGKTLFTLARMINAQKIVEIGVLNGYSSIWLARALPEGGKLYALEKSKERAGICTRNFEKCNVADKITVIDGEALSNLDKISSHGQFDMVFIDADKANYCNYLDWAERNVRKGGLIIGDNTFLFGSVYGDNVRNQPEETIKIMQEFNSRLANIEKYSSIMIPTTEGMTVAVKEF
ncbi:MAG: O-methyltransferase [Rickettsiales bacterium]|nr:O-methyltransferase [Pseudomonadota bacterium]MDA0967124.1 O-methyltransferase [Pseudomonadota bacterium]MDG4542390.1 O-methyltransferase [Rickettsiales bacterium]MDG4544894.1 O-methyltransferase [Rickettsiales bacterium]MDG4547017.1 O-methyltransferase [Rickettsiales bacterium]